MKAAATGDKPRILVVGSEARARESLRVMLQPWYEVASAEGEEAALEALSNFHPDLLFIDVKTPALDEAPTLDGLELLKEVKSRDPKIEAVVVATHTSLEILRKALKEGVFEYLLKPVFRRDLDGVARRALARRRGQRVDREEPSREATPLDDRRRSPRVAVAWSVTLENEDGTQWSGEMIGLGPFGVKVRVETGDSGLSEGSLVRLRFSPPDGKFPTPMSVKGMVWRLDPDGLIIVFIDLNPHAFLRMKSLVKTLLKEPA
jgi:CheY-like chemotaxis protein